MYVPCGRCIACRLTRARMWSVRIMHETKKHKDNCFVTLTYDDVHIPKNGSLVKKDCQDFFKRLRKKLGVEIKYFLGGEYGENKSRPHYHVILFGVGKTQQPIINSAWGNGFVYVGDVTHDSANYVACYTLKKLTGPAKDYYDKKGIIPEFSLMSRRPGIGSRYVDEYKDFLERNAFCIVKGNKVGLPRYYRDKIFDTDEKKEKLTGKAQLYYDERMAKLKALSGAEHGYQVNDYDRTIRSQRQAELKARLELKRRIL